MPGVEASVWNAFFLPKGTPDPIVRKLNKAMSDTVDDPAIRKRLEELGLEIVPKENRTPEYLAKYPAGGSRALGQGDQGRRHRADRLSRTEEQTMVMKLVVAAALALPPGRAGFRTRCHARAWPTRPVTMMVPFPAGGPVDLVARLLSQRLTELLGQPVIVENIGGAGGMTGAARVAKSPPDGSMFVFGKQGSHTFSQMLYKKPLYDAVTDFAPVAVVVENSKLLAHAQGLAGEQSAGVHHLRQGQPSQAAIRLGRHRLGDACRLRAAQQHDRRRHHARALSRHRAGDAGRDRAAASTISATIVSTAQPFVQAGMVKALALLATERSRVYPDLPTADEQGLKGFDRDGWNAFFFPKDTPEPIVRKLAKATSDILDVPEVHDRLESFGLNVPPRERRTPEYLEKLVRSDLEKWAPPVKASGAMASE